MSNKDDLINQLNINPIPMHLHGTIIANTKDGERKYQIDYCHNKRHGVCTCWWADGELFFQEYYINGREVSKAQWNTFDAERRAHLAQRRALRNSRTK